MITEEQVRASLREVIVPEVERSVVDLNLVRDVSLTDGKVNIKLGNAALSPQLQDYIRAGVSAAMKKQKVSDFTLEFVDVKPAELNEIRYVIAVMSGKGGVGKSVVTSLLAIALRRKGNQVGIIDADITGSSIPRMFGIKNRPLGSETGILPVATGTGISVMSMNLLIAQEESAVIWRAPLLSRAINQFWTDVLWGKLDYLLIDLPPGTADAPLTVMQSIPLTGVIIVSTPQGLVEMVVKKAVNMAQKMEKTILGVVENMSYFYVPEVDRRYELFGRSKGKAMAKAAGAPLLAMLPVDRELARLCDDGELEKYDKPVVESLGESFLKALDRAGVKGQ
ncbi:MAG: Mrp/NBP35 family ATP-binding protein [Dehalococcoidia bacterium]|nr:Mrp/NBP35 family ATP-binding protein [Dehalococcoidia bacterium]